MPGLRPVSSQSSPPSYFSVTEWLGKYVQELHAPLSNSWYSPSGFIEMAWRVRLLVLVLLIPLAFYGYRPYQGSNSEIPPEPPVKPLKRGKLDLTSPNFFSPFSPHKTSALKKKTEGATASDLKPTRLSFPSSSRAEEEDLIEIDAKEIDDKFKTIITHLDQLPDQMPLVRELCENFIENHSEHPQYLKFFKTVKSRWDRLSFLDNNYNLIWTHYVAGKGDFLFLALLKGLADYYKSIEKNPSEAPTTGQLRTMILEEMEKMVEKDKTLQKLTDCAIFALSKVLEHRARIKMDQLIKEQPENESRYIAVMEETESFLTLIDHSATLTYPAYFDYMEKGELQFGSINAIYVFSKLFPDIRIAVPKQDGSHDFDFNPEGTFYLELGVGEQKEFIYVKRVLEEDSD